MTRKDDGGSSEGGKKNAARRKPVTLKDVAESLGLSPSTVSLVLNRSPAARTIPEATHQRVFAAAREMNYRPNFVARSLRSRRTYSVGVLVPEISEGYATGVMSGIEDYLLQAGYCSLLASHRFREELIAERLAVLRDRAVEGLIVVATSLREDPELPTVSISGVQQPPDVTQVVLDHDRAAVFGLGHLAELGHERIAVLRGHPLTADSAARWEAISKTAEKMGIPIRPELTLQIGDSTSGESASPEVDYQQGYTYGKRLLETSTDFTALFAFNDISAIAAMKAFFDAGLRVPEDISVVGFDDIQSAAFHNPSLTTVRQPLHEMGRIAGRTLLRRLADEPLDEDPVLVEPELIVRNSTGPASQQRGRRTG